MATPASPATETLLPGTIRQIIVAHFGKDRVTQDLCRRFLTTNGYQREFLSELLTIIRATGGDPWDRRFLATLMAEHMCLRLDAEEDQGEFTFLFESLGLLNRDRASIDRQVLKEGFTSTELSQFASELQQRLGRLARVHREMRGLQTTPEAFARFISCAQEPCRLTLIRYLADPTDVVELISSQLNLSRGVRSPFPEGGAREAQLYLSTLPEYEKAIFQELTGGGRVYWAGEKTPITLNSPIENPIKTVACVVKPPGSAVEFEIKRTGMRQDFPLSAAYAYASGDPLPPSHRLQGGASTASLRSESDSAGVLSEIFRVVHGSEAPLSKVLWLATYKTVPLDGREVHLVDYFTDPDIFGDRYDSVRDAMERCVKAFDGQYGAELAEAGGAYGLTGRFLAHVLPCQGILAQTSSYRLNLLASYLSPDGPDAYFIEGLKQKSFSRLESEHFTQSLLDEALGSYVAPDDPYESHAAYLREVFAVPENRVRADRFHTRLISELGKLWGTLLALGGYSHGESFVGRNMGLKSAFINGEWTVQLFSMDHDCLQVPDPDDASFWPHPAFRATVFDECFICANPGRPNQIDGSALWYIEQIYHVEPATRARSMSLLHEALESSYKLTRQAMNEDPRVQRFLSPSYIRHMHDWDLIVADFLHICEDPKEITPWKARTESYLSSRNYKKDVIANYLKGVEKHDDVVKRYSFLYLNGTL